VIRLVTQFDPPGTHAAEAAIPGGCCSCCCCCCCLATTVSASALAAIQTARKAGEAPVRPARAGLWILLAGGALVAAAVVAGIVAWVTSVALSPQSNPAAAVFALGTPLAWGVLLWIAFRGVGFKVPQARAAAFVVVGAIAFVIEVIAGAFLVVYLFPLYLLAAVAVIGGVIWLANRPRARPPTPDTPPEA
jgi:hypothetical protein